MLLVLAATVAVASVSNDMSVGSSLQSDKRPLGIAAVGFSGWMVLSTSMAVDRWHAVVGTPDRRFGLLAWLLVVLAVRIGVVLAKAHRTLVHSLHLGLVLAALSVTLVSGAQLIGWVPSGGHGFGGRWTGLYGQPIYLGMAALFFGLASLGLALDRSQRLWWRVLALFGAMGCVVTLVGSAARGPALGAALGAAIMSGGLLVGSGRVRRWRLGRAVLVLATVGMAGAVLVAGRDRGFSRFDEWQIALHAIESAPLFGFGPEGYRVVFGQFVTEGYVQRYGAEVFTDRAHNGLADLALTGGVVAAGFYLACLTLMSIRVWDRRLQMSTTEWGVVAGCGGFLIAQQTLFPIVVLDPIVALYLGTLLWASPSSPVVQGDTQVFDLVPRRIRWLRMLTGSSLLFLACLAAVVGGRETLAERKLSVEAQSWTIDQSDVLHAVELAPDSIRVRYVASQLLVQGGTILDLDAGIAQLEAGLAISSKDPALQQRHGELLVQRAQRSGSTTDREAAWEVVSRLIEVQPFSPRALLLASEAARLVGDEAEASRLAGRAADLQSE